MNVTEIPVPWKITKDLTVVAYEHPADRPNVVDLVLADGYRIAESRSATYFQADDEIWLPNSMAVAYATTPDDLLTALARLPHEDRTWALAACGPKILRAAADLVGAGDADTMTKRAAIAAILENF
jgi:hypothetical protein